MAGSPASKGKAYFDMFMVSVVGPLVALVAVLAAGITFGSF